MDDQDKRIEDILAGMQFERRLPPSKQIKAEYAALEADVGGILRDLSRLHLRLWHAVFQRDYHSLSPQEARLALEDIRERLGRLSQAE
jgi:hypothetical protein